MEPTPYDRVWRDAASPFGWMLPQAVALPLRLGAPAGPWLDAARWSGSFASALILIELGAMAAAPSAGAAAAAVALLDPAAYSGKPLASLFGIGVVGESAWSHQLLSSRLYNPALTFPFLALALLALWRLAARPWGAARRAVALAAFALVGASAFTFFWTLVLAATPGVLLRRRTRRQLAIPLAVAAGLLVACAALNAIGTRGEDATGLGLRIGFSLTHRPILLGHAAFWAGALAALWLGFGAAKVPLGARLLGRSVLGMWALPLLVTPLTGWDIQSHHFSYALGPVFTLVWCVAAWHAWQRHGRRRAAALAGWALVACVGLLGPSWALLGAAVSTDASGPGVAQRLEEALRVADLPARSLVLVPRPLRGVLGGLTDHVAFGHEYLHLFAVPDSVVWSRQVCAAVLTGEDSAQVTRALSPLEGGLPMWGWGRPSGFPMAGVRSYHQIAARLAALQGSAVAAARRAPRLLRAACADRPDFAFAAGRARVRAALAAGTLLGATVLRVPPDSAWAWLDLRPRRFY